MPCYQPSSFPPGFSTTGRPSYKTEAECNQACQEGACCEGTTCTVKPQCQCQGTGKVFKGVGTVCTPGACKCCCINGGQTSQQSDEQCVASGGIVRNYVCGKPAPSSILLTLSLTNYTTTLTNNVFGSGVWNFDFSCIKTSYTLVRGGGGSAYPSKLYMSVAPEAHVAVDVSTSGSFNEFYSNESCACPVPLLLGLSIRSNVATVAYLGPLQSQPQLNCSPLSITAGNSYGFSLLLAGQSSVDFSQAVEVLGFCEGQYSVSGTVVGPGDVQCGTFTLGNPLP